MGRGRWMTGALAALALVLPATAAAQAPPYLDRSYSFAERAADLVGRMTFAEKAHQLATTNAPAIPRLGVQQYSYWNEAAHGISLMFGDYHRGGANAVFAVPATSYPTPLAAAASWDPALLRRMGGEIGDEARGFLDPSLFGRGENNLGPTPRAYGSLTYWSPTINLLRDPRWGRADEQLGEDPLLEGTLAGALVQGMQGADAEVPGGYLKTAATAKHLALNSVEANRLSGSSDTDEATIRDYYTAPFRAVSDAGVAGLMSAYNAINGVPAAANALTLNVLARRTWAFGGYVTSDCGGIGTTYLNAPDGHAWAPPGWTSDLGDRAVRWRNLASGALISGQAGGQAYALRAGTDLNCLGALGEAGHPVGSSLNAGSFENDPARLREALAARALSEGVIDRALTNAFTVRMRTGEFDPRDAQPYTRIGKDVIESPAHRQTAEDVAAASLVLLQNEPAGGTPVLPAVAADVDELVIVGDLADTVTLGGYSGAPTERVSVRQGLTERLRATNPGANVVFDACGTSTRATGPADCAPATDAALATADLVVVMVGTDAGVLAEAQDRSTIALPGNHGSLVDLVGAAGNPRTVLLAQSSGPVGLEAARGQVGAILASAPNGQRQGRAAAAVVFGDVNPSGRLPYTWYRDDAQLPAMADYDLVPSRTGGLGRTYQHFTGTPSWPFGFGLSYTTFAFSGAALDRPAIDAGGTARVAVTVANTGTRAGATVAQVYATAPASAGPEAPYRLAGFAKTRVLAPGEAQALTIEVPAARLARWDPATRRQAVAPGTWTLSVATAARASVADLALDVSGAVPRDVRAVTVRPERLVLAPGEAVALSGKNAMLTGLAPRPEPAAEDTVAAVRADDSFADVGAEGVAYASNRPGIASVDAAGRVTAHADGVATITATVGGRTGSATFVVRTPPPAPPPAPGPVPDPPRPPQPPTCTLPAGLRSVTVTPRDRGRRLELRFSRRVRVPVTIDVLQHARGRRVQTARTVARYAGRAAAVTWAARGARDGTYAVRFRMTLPRGITDTRTVVVRRSGGRFTVRPATTRPPACGLIRAFALTRPVFGGTTRAALALTYRLDRDARVGIEIRRGTRVVRRVATVARRAGRTYRVKVAAAGLRTGEHTVRLTATPPGGRGERAVLTARRL